MAAALLAGAASAWGIVVSDDPALHVVSPPSDFDMVGYLNTVGGSTGVLVNPWFVLTAGHALNYMNSYSALTLQLPGGSQSYPLIEKFVHPTADLALVRLGASTGLPGYGLYEGSAEVGQTGLLVGYGMSGTGYTVGDGGDPNYPRGTKRFGYNRIDAIGYDGSIPELRMDFDSPGSGPPFGTLGADKEVMIALGDSGGPTLLTSGQKLLVGGIHVRVIDDGDVKWPDYGDTGCDIRVSAYASWINGIIPDQPATETGDFNMDAQVNQYDIDAMFGCIRAGGGDLWYDLTHDGLVNHNDADDLVGGILNTSYGDADLNHVVDGADYTVWADHYKMTGMGWAEGDFNGDTVVDGADYTLWADNFQAASGQSMLLPEPATLLLVVPPACLLLRRRRRIA